MADGAVWGRWHEEAGRGAAHRRDRVTGRNGSTRPHLETLVRETAEHSRRRFAAFL